MKLDLVSRLIRLFDRLHQRYCPCTYPFDLEDSEGPR